MRKLKYRCQQNRAGGQKTGFVEYLGRRHYFPGSHGSPESLRAFADFQDAVYAKAPPPSIARGTAIRVDQAVLLFLEFADQRYRDEEGRRTQNFGHFRSLFRVLIPAAGSMLLRDFGPKAIKALRLKMLEATKTVRTKEGPKVVPANWTRPFVNAQVGRVRRWLKWCVAEELCPPSVLQAAQTIEPLREGETSAPEGRVVEAVEQTVVEGVLPFLSPTVAAMVRLQLLTGMRSGEVCIMRPCDIDRSEAGDGVWLYRPTKWKGQKKTKTCKIVQLGPQAQAVIEPFLARESEAYLFSPAETMAWKSEQRWLGSKRSVRKRPKTTRKLTGRYNPRTYRRSILYGIAVAQTQHWHPHQIRHTAATEIRKRYKLDGAQAALGHARADVTQVYAERDAALARKIAREMG